MYVIDYYILFTIFTIYTVFFVQRASHFEKLVQSEPARVYLGAALYKTEREYRDFSFKINGATSKNGPFS